MFCLGIVAQTKLSAHVCVGLRLKKSYAFANQLSKIDHVKCLGIIYGFNAVSHHHHAERARRNHRGSTGGQCLFCPGDIDTFGHRFAFLAQPCTAPTAAGIDTRGPHSGLLHSIVA